MVEWQWTQATAAVLGLNVDCWQRLVGARIQSCYLLCQIQLKRQRQENVVKLLNHERCTLRALTINSRS